MREKDAAKLSLRTKWDNLSKDSQPILRSRLSTSLF